MVSEILDPLFAWSWGGHGQLTNYAVAYAVGRLIVWGKSHLLARFDAIYMHMDRDDDSTDVFAAMQIQNEFPTPFLPTDAVTHSFYVFASLPSRVQMEDIHAGNIPWGIGEALDSTGQVRHFMRSREEISSYQAYIASKSYIRFHALQAWLYLRDAVNVKPGEAWDDKLHDWFLGHRDIGLLDTGLASLARALHTIEDSYAPGHVTRLDGLNWIKQVNIWDEDNKNGDPAHAIPSHEEYDNPQNAKSQPFFQAAREATGELIACVLGNLDQDELTFKTALDNLLARFLATCMPGTL